MFSAILDVGLGLVILFLVLSIMASAASELITNLLQRRAKNLEKFIAGTLVDSGITVADFYTNTLIAPHMNGNKPPNYIHASDFTEALFTTLRNKFPSAIAPTEGELPDFSLAELKQTVASMPDSAPLKAVLSSVIVRAQDNPATQGLTDVAKVRAAMENWYDNSMDRVSGWFKSNTTYILLFIGLGLAVVFNVDTIAVTNNLLQNPGVRSALTARSAEVAAALATVNPPQSTAVPGQPTPQGVAPTANLINFQQTQTLLSSLNMPIGWPDRDMTDHPETINLFWWLKKIIGIMITGFAVSQGAPFWFDLLNRVTNLRSAGNPPPKSTAAG